jgi:hypothetical protein
MDPSLPFSFAFSFPITTTLSFNYLRNEIPQFQDSTGTCFLSCGFVVRASFVMDLGFGFGFRFSLGFGFWVFGVGT